MRHDLATAVLGGLLNAAFVLLAAPFAQGLVRKLTARLQSRRGPPLRQPYFDLLKLLGKEDLEAGEAPLVQRLAAALSLGTALAVACLLPMGGPAPLAGRADAVALVYLMMLSGLSTVLAGAAAGSTFSLLGTSREVMTMLALDPILAVAVVVGAIHAGSFQLDAVLDGAVWSAAVPLSGALMLAVMLLAFQAFVARVPFDLAEAETELMGGPLLEYSGPKLALFEYARMVKLLNAAALFVALFVPWGAHLPFPAALALFWVKVLALVVVVTLVAATHARFRMDQALRFYAGLLVVALGAVVLASRGY